MTRWPGPVETIPPWCSRGEEGGCRVGTRMAKPALDVGLITAEAEPLLAFYEAVAGLERLEPQNGLLAGDEIALAV